MQAHPFRFELILAAKKFSAAPSIAWSFEIDGQLSSFENIANKKGFDLYNLKREAFFVNRLFEISTAI